MIVVNGQHSTTTLGTVARFGSSVVLLYGFEDDE